MTGLVVAEGKQRCRCRSSCHGFYVLLKASSIVARQAVYNSKIYLLANVMDVGVEKSYGMSSALSFLECFSVGGRTLPSDRHRSGN